MVLPDRRRPLRQHTCALVLHVTCAAWVGCRHRHRAGGWDCASISSKLLRCISHYDSNNLHGLLLHICIVGDGLSVLDVMAAWPFGLKCASKPRPPAFLVLAHCALHPHAVGLHRRHPPFGEHDLCACTLYEKRASPFTVIVTVLVTTALPMELG